MTDRAPSREGPASARSPYPGLRSFSREEADIFFGRDRCIGGMTETLQATRFLAVLGPSGSGKSSLVRSGLFMHLEAGLARKAGSRWTFLDIRHPRTTPFTELARLTIESERPADSPESREELSREAIEERRKALSRDPFALVRWWTERPGRHPEENLLLLVDQFEELFGYSTDRERNEVEAFIDLLLESARQDKVPVYVVITMRSEFLGGCSLFPGLAEQINASLSLTPRMTREECREAITGPAYGDELVLDPLLVTAILNDMNSLARFDEPGEPGGEAENEAPEISQADLIARRADQLPLMQHVLNWMWNIQASAPGRDPSAPIRLDLDSYLELGRLRGAMNLHADDVMAGTGDPEAVARIFRALTDQPTVATSGSAESSAVRRRRTVAELAQEAGVDPDRVRKVVDAYRAEGVSMLNPDPETYPRLEDGDEVDISHESLIRQWAALRGWIREEGEAGRSWQELLRDVDKGVLLTGLDLAERKGWWERAQPHAGWADRYLGRFDEVDDVMKRSVRREQRRKILLRTATVGAVALAVVSVGSVGFTQIARQEAARALALAEQEASEAEQSRRTAIAQTRKARGLAEASRAQARDALALKAQAQEDAANAKEQAAAAAEQMRQAVAEVGAVRAEKARIYAEVTTTILEGGRKQLGLVARQVPVEAVETLSAVEANSEILRKTDPVAYAQARRLVGSAKGDMAANQFSVANMEAAASELESAAGMSAGAGSAEPDMLVAAASVLRGRVEAMKGNEEGARNFFAEAIGRLPSSGTDAVRLARAEAQSRQASALLDLGETTDAAAAAADCRSSLPASGEGPNPAAREIVAARCLTVLAATDPDPASSSWREAAEAMEKVPDETAALRLARSDLLVAYFGMPWRREEEDPFDLVGTLGLVYEKSLTRYLDGSAGADTSPESILGEAQDPYRNQYLRQSLQDARMINQIVDLAMRRPRAEVSQGIESIFPTLLTVDRLLSSVSKNLSAEDNPLALQTAVEAYEALGRNRLAVAPFLSVEKPDSYRTLTRQAIQSFAAHFDLLKKLPTSERYKRAADVRRLAAALVNDSRRFVSVEPYGAVQGGQLDASIFNTTMCMDVSDDTGCAELQASIAALEQEHKDVAGRLAAQARRSPTSPDSPWADENGIALGGIDLVSCFRGVDRSNLFGAKSAQGVAQSNATDQGADPQGPSCPIVRGRLQYGTVWGGRAWVFESADNRARFQTDPQRYLPGVGGYDVIEASQGRLARPDGSSSIVVRFNNRLYLGSYLHTALSVPPEAIRDAEANWPRLRATIDPHGNPPPVAPLERRADPIELPPADPPAPGPADPTDQEPQASPRRVDDPSPDQAPPEPRR